MNLTKRDVDPRLQEYTVRGRAAIQTALATICVVDGIGYIATSGTGTLQFRVADLTFLVTVRVCPGCVAGTCEPNAAHQPTESLPDSEAPEPDEAKDLLRHIHGLCRIWHAVPPSDVYALKERIRRVIGSDSTEGTDGA